MKGQFHEIILNVLRPFMVNDLVKIEFRASKPNALEDNEIEEEEEEEVTLGLATDAVTRVTKTNINVDNRGGKGEVTTGELYYAKFRDFERRLQENGEEI